MMHPNRDGALSVMPLVNARYRVLAGAANTRIGGFSYGGVAALFTAMTRPDLADRLLLESTPLWIGPERRLLREVAAVRQWPGRVDVGSGGRESPEEPVRLEGVRDTDSLVALIRRAAPKTDIRVVVARGAKHEPDAWRTRFPEALRFLFHR